MIIKNGVSKLSLIFYFELKDVYEFKNILDSKITFINGFFVKKDQYISTKIFIQIVNSKEYIEISKSEIKLFIDQDTKEQILYLLNGFIDNDNFPLSECCELDNFKIGTSIQLYFQKLE